MTSLRLLSLSCFLLLLTHPATAQWLPGGTQLSATAANNVDPKLAPIPGGGAFVTWIENTTEGRVYLMALDAHGNPRPGWPVGGMPVTNPGTDIWKTEILASDDSTAILVWYGYAYTGMGTRQIFAQKYSLLGMPMWNAVSPTPVSQDTARHHLNPFAISDGNGGVFITWFATDLSLLPSTQDVFVQHIDNIGAVANGWPGAPVAIADSAGLVEGLPQLQLSADGNNLYVTYLTGSINVRLLMQNIDPLTGAFQAGYVKNAPKVISNGPNIYTNAGREPRLFSDSASRLVVLWPEFRSLGEIYYQKMNPGGTAVYAPGGIMVASNTADDLTYFDAYQQANDALTFAWRITDGNTDVIHVKRIAGGGTAEWASDFVTTSLTSAYPKLAANEDGSLYLANKEFGPPDHLHGMRISSTGQAAPGWTLPGTDFGEIGNPDGFVPQRDFRILAQPEGNALLAWVRKGPDQLYDVFACNLRSDGVSCTVNLTGRGPITPAGELRLWPNPGGEALRLSLPSTGQVQLRLHNACGQVVLTWEGSPGPELQLNTADLAPGLYAVELSAGDRRWTGKWVKE